MIAEAALVAARSVNEALNAGAAGVPVAFLVGVVSFFTPCILPLAPGYLSYMSGLSGEALASGEGRHRVLLGTVLFVLGFGVVFSALGATASALGGFLNDNRLWFERISGAIVIAMGIAFLLPGAIAALERERRPLLSRVPGGLAGAFPLGVAFAVGWTPCVGPGLGTILTLAATDGSALHGAVLLFSFSLGFGMWFVLGGLAFRRATAAITVIRRRQRGLQLIGGSMLLLIGLLLVTNLWAAVMAPVLRLVNRFTVPI